MKNTIALVAALALVPSLALAQAADPAAQAVFDEGLRLYEAGDYAAACPKLASAVELSPGGGLGAMTLLAQCHEKAGAFASSWAAYHALAARAARAGQADRRTQAEEGAARVEPKLHRLRLQLAADVAAIPGLVVLQRGRAIPRDAWAVPVPVDPGDVVVHLEAPGYVAADRTVTIPATPGETPLAIEALQRAPEAVAPPFAPPPLAPPPPPRQAPPRDEGGLHGLGIAGLVVGGVGVVTMGISIGVAMAAKSSYDDAASRCSEGVCRDDADLQASEDARSQGNVGTALFVVGGVLTAAGATLLVVDLAGGSDDARAGVASPTARLELRPGALSATGSF